MQHDLRFRAFRLYAMIGGLSDRLCTHCQYTTRQSLEEKRLASITGTD